MIGLFWNQMQIVPSMILGFTIIILLCHGFNNPSQILLHNPFYGSTMLTSFGKLCAFISLRVIFLESPIYKIIWLIFNKYPLMYPTILTQLTSLCEKMTLIDQHETELMPFRALVVSSQTFENFGNKKKCWSS